MRRLALFTTSVMALLGCTKTNDLYCDGHPGAAGCPDGGGSGVPACKNDDGCTGNAAGSVCDTAQSKCVQCTSAHDACDKAGTTPICDTAAETCGACTTDDQCGTGGFCLPSGACAAATTVIHAASTGTDPQPACGNGTPQKPCSLDDALTIAAADPTKKVIQLDDSGPFISNGAQSSQAPNFLINTNIAIEAGQASFHKRGTSQGNGPILKVTNGHSLTLIGGTIEGADGSGGDGIQCDTSSSLFIKGTTIQMNKESAIDSSGCSVTIDSAKILSNSVGGTDFTAISVNNGTLILYQSTITQNRGGEVDIRGGATFQIVGNSFQNNGDQTGPNPGIAISSSGSSKNRFEFNTISANKSQAPSGIQCIAGTFTAQNNIIWNNMGAPLGGNCIHDYSFIGPTPGYPAGTDGGHNRNDNPLLISETNNPHIQSNSPARRYAHSTDLTGIAARDIDDQPRVAPADVGADQTP